MRLDALNPAFASKITDDAVACAQSLGYSKQMIAWGFDHMFAHWAPTTWIDFLRGEIPALSPTHAQTLCNADLPDEDRAQIWANTLGKNKRIYQRIVLVPASTVPSAVFQDICQILILPVALTLRPPRAHIDLYTTWKHHINQYMPAFGARLAIAQPSHDDDDTRQLCRSHNAIVISGSDATIAHYRTLCANLDPSLRPHIVAHGHKISAICIDAPAFQRLDDDDFNHLLYICCLEPLAKQIGRDSIGEAGSRLSGGEQRRVMLARALANRPKLLIIDQMTSEIEPELCQTIFSRIVEDNPKIGILYLGHRQPEWDV